MEQKFDKDKTSPPRAGLREVGYLQTCFLSCLSPDNCYRWQSCSVAAQVHLSTPCSDDGAQQKNVGDGEQGKQELTEGLKLLSLDQFNNRLLPYVALFLNLS